jgi:hypothetical protein
MSTWQLVLNGQPADQDLYTLIASVEVEESLDLPSALQLAVPVSRTGNADLLWVSDSRFAPLSNLALVAAPSANGSTAVGVVDAIASAVGGAGARTQCIFDGYVLSQKLHLERGTTDSMLTVWAQDASWLMNLTENVKEWVDVTDADVAAAIFGDYGIAPSDQNRADDSPSHTEDGHSLMQRATDIQFLRMLARRNGKICRVVCTDTPGQRTGYFTKPNVDGDPVVTFVVTDQQHWTLGSLDLSWDAGRPTEVLARQALFTDADKDGVSADVTDTGLAKLGERDLAAFLGRQMSVLLATPVDDGGELTLRARSLLREAAWFVRCEGASDVERLGMVLRAGMVVAIQGIGPLHSGKYLVWSVRHTITPETHAMKFTLVRNAVGPAPSGGVGGLAGAVGLG